MGDLWVITFEHWPHLLGVGAILAALASLAHVLIHKRSAQATLAWAGLIALVPLFGALFYLLFGINRIRRAGAKLRDRRQRKRPDQEDPFERDFEQAHSASLITRLAPPFGLLDGQRALVERVTGLPLLGGNAIEFLRDGDQAYPAMLEAIKGAQRSIVLSSYIFEYDEAGKPLVDALIQAHQRGVRVHVIIDSVGARYSHPTALSVLKRAGVPASAFLPILRPGRLSLFMNLRTHRKIMVVDGLIGFTGGINIRHHHVIKANPDHPTHDAHFKLTGPVVFNLQRVLVEDWFFCEGELLRGAEYFPGYLPQGTSLARAIVDGPDEDYLNLQLTLLGALQAATRHVVIITPYFAPDEALLSALEVAALRGVEVELFLPERSNLRFIDFASASLWEPLLESGVKIWLVSGSFDHAKLMVVDGQWSLFGSGNWDARSLQLNFEFNVEAYDITLSERLLALAQEKRDLAKLVELEDYRRRSTLVRLRDGLFKLFIPYL